MALALERFAGVLARTREREDANGRADVGAFMATADEYIRLIGSVRVRLSPHPLPLLSFFVRSRR